MKDRTEFDLLVIAEEIEPGDVLVVEEDGEEIYMVFVKELDAKTVLLKDRSKQERLFSKLTLEERDGEAFIIGKKE